MNNSTALTGKKLDNFLNRLSDLVYTLPTADTKDRLDKELAALIAFLQDFQERLKSIPTGDNADDVASTIETLKRYVRIAESDPLMSHVLGLSPDQARTGRKDVMSAQARSQAKSLADELRQLSPEDIGTRLVNSRKYTVAMLKQIAKELGLHVPSKSTRLSIIEQIAKKTANARGYRHLRGEDDQGPRASL